MEDVHIQATDDGTQIQATIPMPRPQVGSFIARFETFLLPQAKDTFTYQVDG
jgi:hypothetical protein